MPFFHIVRLSEAALIWADCPMLGAAGPELHGAVHQLLDDNVVPIVIDLVRVPAVDDGVVAVLAEAATRAGEGGGRGLELRLVGGRRYTCRDAAQLRRAIAQAYPTAA